MQPEQGIKKADQGIGQTKRNAGKVYLVGAGPGAPGLITLRGVECLQAADVVLFDYLVNPRILQHLRPEAEAINLGRHGQSRIWPQHEINQQLVQHARAGKVVVRLKGGDPAVFARGAEEVEALVEAGVEFEMVPGVTVALAAGSYAGIPVTHRDQASAVALVTAQENPGKQESSLDYDALARFPGTLVFYMGVTTVNQWTEQLIRAGKSPETPAAVIRRCSFSDQKIFSCRLGEVAEQLSKLRIRPPAIVIVGTVVELSSRLAWFERRPLFGKRVMVTRPVNQSADLAHLLEEQGAEVILHPVIEIRAPRDWSEVDQVVGELHRFDWLVFSSANGVGFFLDRMLETGLDMRQLANARLAAVGPGTSRELAGYHLRADLTPEVFRAEALADELVRRVEGKTCLIVRGSRARETLGERLTKVAAEVKQLVVYRNLDVPIADETVRRQLKEGAIDWITATSPAIARSLSRLFEAELSNAHLASISPLTSSALEAVGCQTTAEATEYTIQGIVEAILAAAQSADSSTGQFED